VTTPEFKRVHQLAMGETALSAKDVEAGTWKRSGLYASGPGGSAGIVSEPAVSGQAGDGQVGGGQPGDGPASGRLSRDALGIGGKMVRLQAPRFRMNYPANWQKQVSANGTVILAPVGGAGAMGIVYGALIDLEKQSGDGVSDAASLNAATLALAQRLSQQNAGLAQVGAVSAITLSGQMANGLELRGRSPALEGGAALPERDWLVTIARPDGDLNYIVFVSPERDFAMMKPLFVAMMQSFLAQ
jgi:beta-barrel assembly-enhancing protease